jgi:hypothetical protein
MTIINDIRACLDNQLTNTSSIPVVAKENVAYVHQAGTSFIKAAVVPTSRRPATRGPTPQQLYQGLYTLLICTPEAKGAGAGYDIADTLLASFEATKDITYNGLSITIDYSEVRGSFLDSPFYCTPINVAWYCYHL